MGASVGFKRHANIHELRPLLGRLFHVAQCCPLTSYFVNRMLSTLRECPHAGYIELNSKFKKDLHWFEVYLPHTNGIYLIHQDNRVQVEVFVDACTTCCSAICHPDAYHAEFPHQLLAEQHPVCHLEVLNALGALRRWAPRLKGQLIQLYIDSITAVDIFQAGEGRDAFRKICAKEP